MAANVRVWLNRYAERWRVLLPFLALGVSFVVSLWLVVALIHTNSARIREARQRDREACVRQHATVRMFRLFLVEGSRQFERRPVRGDGRELRRFQRRAARLLDRADCRSGGRP